MAVSPTYAGGILTYSGAPSPRLEAPGEPTQLLEKRWADFPGPILFVSDVPANSVGIDGQTALVTPTGAVWQKVDTTWQYTGYTIAGGITRYYGSFFDTTTQTAALPNTAYAMTYDTTDASNGVSIVSGSRITIANTGVYNIQFSAQIDKTSGQGSLVFIWLRKKGIDVAWSAGEIAIGGSLAQNIAVWNYFVSATAGDYYEIMWSVQDASIRLLAAAASTPVPAIPSVILTVNQVA